MPQKVGFPPHRGKGGGLIVSFGEPGGRGELYAAGRGRYVTRTVHQGTTGYSPRDRWPIEENSTADLRQ
jgi:hypothetical protein